MNDTSARAFATGSTAIGYPMTVEEAQHILGCEALVEMDVTLTVRVIGHTAPGELHQAIRDSQPELAASLTAALIQAPVDGALGDRAWLDRIVAVKTRVKPRIGGAL